MNFKIKLRQKGQVIIIATAVITVASFMMTSNLISFVWADSINPSVYSKDDKPYGLTYGQWTANFWKWVISIPQQNNPNNDPTGAKCAINQNDSNVWYLAPTFGGSAERTCTIPSGKAILFPLLVGECSYAENPNLKSESQLRACAMEGQNVPRSMDVIIDGTKLKNLDNYRTQSQLFDLTYPENNVFSGKPGNSKAVSDGFWVFLKPLSPGKHELEFSASTIDPSGVNNYNTHVKYHLIVSP
jgi:hypothetical protein